MNKKLIRILSVVILSIIISCEPISVFALDSVSPNETAQEDVFLDELNIINDCAILTGQVQQMKVQETNSGFLLKWSSSNPSVISCDSSGEIKGLKEGKAVITAEALFGKGKDSITVYCAKKLISPKSSLIAQPFAWSSKIPFFIPVQAIHFNMFPVFASSKLNVKGVYGSYFYVEFERNNKQFEGFILQNWMPNNIASGEVFKQLSAYDIDAYVGVDKDSYRVTTNYKGDVNWSVSDSSIIDFDSSTGKFKTKKPGIATISATANGKTLTCTVHSIYTWPQNWTGAALQETCVYKAKGNGYEKTSTLLSVGDKFIVKGDMGNSDGWAYGVSESGTWGYIPINHLSTKGTISQCNNLKTTLKTGEKVSWIWPVKDVKNGVEQTSKARYITSPYGWRDTVPTQHKGIDITNGVSSNSDLANSVDGYEVVSAFEGTVIYVYDISSGYKSCGNCVAIRSSEKDPITEKYYVAIYMHLKSKPNVTRNQKIYADTLLGYVGDTGNSVGSHLHFEVNNQNLSYGQKIYYENDSDKEMVFGSVINPLFFYMNYYNLPEKDPAKININSTCEAMDYRKPLWFGDDIKESKKP